VKNVFVHDGDGTLGFPSEAPYDRIIVTAGAPRVPKALLGQLSDGGRLLAPVGGRMVQELVSVEKRGGMFSQKNLGGCVFVPLVGEDGW
jgi:protein-L-isoaspartate(D-aspartate) O-methyltransferase